MSTIQLSANFREGVRSQLKLLRWWALWTFIPILLLFGLVFYLSELDRAPLSIFVSDPASTMGAPFYIGLVSNIGVLGWNAAAVICLFSAYILYFLKQDREFAGFFLWSGAITLLLLLDDFFMLHDAVFYIYLHINENVIYVIYFLLLTYYLVRYHRTLRKTPVLILAIAFGLFVTSTVVDKSPGLASRMGLLLPFDDELLLIAEDGTKFFAIISWLAYFVAATTQRLRAVLARP